MMSDELLEARLRKALEERAAAKDVEERPFAEGAAVAPEVHGDRRAARVVAPIATAVAIAATVVAVVVLRSDDPPRRTPTAPTLAAPAADVAVAGRIPAGLVAQEVPTSASTVSLPGTLHCPRWHAVAGGAACDDLAGTFVVAYDASDAPADGLDAIAVSTAYGAQPEGLWDPPSDATEQLVTIAGRPATMFRYPGEGGITWTRGDATVEVRWHERPGVPADVDTAMRMAETLRWETRADLPVVVAQAEDAGGTTASLRAVVTGARPCLELVIAGTAGPCRPLHPVGATGPVNEESGFVFGATVAGVERVEPGDGSGYPVRYPGGFRELGFFLEPSGGMSSARK